MAGEGTPLTIESSENRAGADMAAGGGLPADGQGRGATAGVGGMSKDEGAQEAGAGTGGSGGRTADMETSSLSRGPGDVSARQEMIRSIRERRMAEEEKIDADRRELAELIERGTEFLSPGQIRRIVQCLEGTSEEPLPMLQRLDGEIRQLVRDNPEAEPSAIGEAAEEAVRTIVAQAIKSKELARQRGQLVGRATYLDRRGVNAAPQPTREQPQKYPCCAHGHDAQARRSRGATGR